MKEYKLNIRVGDDIEIGRFRNVIAKIKANNRLFISAGGI